MKFYPAKITEVHQATKDVILLSFMLAEGQLSDIDYYPGHHIILRVFIDGTEYRRPYALTNTPFLEERLSIAVKRIKGGPLSTYLHKHAAVDLEVELSAAQGFFYADINSEVIEAYYLIAQGIGFAPIYSILKSILAAETLSLVYVYYESTDRDNILFHRELELLEQDYPNRLNVLHTLSSPSFIPSLKSWKGQKGKINKSNLLRYLERHPLTSEKIEFFICGSPDMNKMVYTELINLDVDPTRIHREQFYIETQTTIKETSQEVQIKVQGKEQLFSGDKSKSILSSLESAGQRIPYACRQGICGTCASKLLYGEVTLNNQHALEDIDIAGGWILTCQSCPKGDVVIDFGDDQFTKT